MDELFSMRLTELIENSNYTLDTIAEAANKKAATISRYASGEIKGVKRSTIISLANLFGVSPAWLAGLSDEKFIDNKITRIPVLNKIDISNILAQQNIIDYISIRTSNNWNDVENYFAIEVTEDNMLPLLDKGDLAIAHIQNTIESGQTAIIFIKDSKQYSIRKIIIANNGIELQSMNPYYPVEKLESINEITIIGRIIKADIERAFE
ncbi:MAG: LexA family transcriptional regulator [Clostridia bacterium]|nr:LexA family transcriptional regulator [Clostridia bacterium]